MDWKRRMIKPSKRTLIYSKKLDKWLDESEEDVALLEILVDKRNALMKKLQETDSTLTEMEAQGLAEEMLSDKAKAVKLLQEGDDEPQKEESSSDGSGAP